MPAPWDQLSAAEQIEQQLGRLRRFLRTQVIPYHPYYRELFERESIDPDSIRTLRDLEKIPFSHKGLVAPTAECPDQPRSFVLQPTPELLRAHLPLGRKLGLLWLKLRKGEAAVKKELGREYRPLQVFFTTGRTALPTSFVLSGYDLDLLETAGGRIAEVVGIDPAEDTVLSLFPYAPHLAFWQVQAVAVASSAFCLQTGGGKVMGTEGILRALGKIRPSILCGIPGFVYHVVRNAVEESIDLSRVRTVFLGGDRIMGGFREKLCDLLRRGGATAPRVLSVFGFTEARRCWAECRDGGEGTGLHTYPDLDIFEVVDPDSGETLPEGEAGELVYTAIDGRASVVLRYRTGDIVNGGITRDRCPACGRMVPRLSSDLGRASNNVDFALTKIKGVLVNLNVLADIMNGHAGVDEWQLVIRKRNDDPFEIDEMVVSLSTTGPNPEQQEVVADLRRRIFDAIELRPTEFELVDRDEILERLGMETRLKENRFVDLRPDGASPPSAPGAAASESAASAEQAPTGKG